MRTVIIGNSGSGKSWLAAQLSRFSGVPIAHLDDLFWLPGGFNRKRDPCEVSLLVEDRLAVGRWIAEGVFGGLAQQFLPSAQTLIWLDLPWDVCRQRLQSRGSQSKAHMGREQSEQGLRELMEWASCYATRPGSTGRAAHKALLDSFAGECFRFESEADVDKYLYDLRSGVSAR